MNAPDRMLWRRRDVMEFLGVSDQVMTQLVSAGTLNPVYLREGGRAFYCRNEVVRLARAPQTTESTER